MLSHGSEGLNLGYNYYSLPTIYPPPPTLSLKWGGGLYSNIWLVLTIHPHEHVDAVKSHNDLAVAIWRNSSDIGHVPWESSQVCWYFL